MINPCDCKRGCKVYFIDCDFCDDRIDAVESETNLTFLASISAQTHKECYNKIYKEAYPKALDNPALVWYTHKRVEKGNVMTQAIEKPTCKLIGEDGNVFNIIGLVQKSLRRAGMQDKAKEFANLAMQSESYGAVLTLAGEYVDIY